MAASSSVSPPLPGVFYADAPHGERLAILDITHPAFQIDAVPADLELEAAAWAKQQNDATWLRRLFIRWVLPRILKRSRIGRGLVGAKGAYLDGLSTYFMKLGPAALPSPAFTELDRRISGSIGGKLLRLRVQDLAQVQAVALAPLLHAGPERPLVLLNLAGGPASDSLNTLLLLHRARPALLGPRRVAVELLDLNTDGPAFAAAALAAWQAPGAPLEGLGASLLHSRYDWAQPVALETALRGLPPRALLLATSEGGLFDYADDATVAANLRLLHQLSPADSQVCGSLTRPDGPGRFIREGSVAAVLARKLEDFTTLAGQAGWALAEHWVRPTITGFRLVKG